jgi:hypothetical protein
MRNTFPTTAPALAARAVLGPSRVPVPSLGQPFSSNAGGSVGHGVQVIQSLRPQGLVVASYFDRITVPAGLTITAGQSAWYGLLQLRSDESGPVGDEFSVDQARIELGPTDPSGMGHSSEAAPLTWGTTLGLRAAIIIGIGLDWVRFNAWSSGAVQAPGIEDAHTLNGQNPARYLVRQGFPPGKINDTIPAKIPYSHPLGVGVARVQRNQTLTVALVLRRDTVNNLAAQKTLCGYGLVQLNVQPNTPDPGFAGA